MKSVKVVSVFLAASMLLSVTAYSENTVVPQSNTYTVELSSSGMYDDFTKITSEFISEFPEKTEMLNELLQHYLADPEICSEYEFSPQSAKETFEKAIEIELEILSDENCVEPAASAVIGSGLGMMYYCYVDESIEQEEIDWCGVASTLMALTGIEEYNRGALVSGYVRPTQSQIADSVYDSSAKSALVYLIKNYLNQQITSGKYTYKEITSSVTKTQVKNYIKNSLEKNRPVILHAKPYQAFDYYSGFSSTVGHYIVVEDYNSYSNTFTVADCTYLNEYQGSHGNITLDEIYDSLYSPSNGVSGRYIIYA